MLNNINYIYDFYDYRFLYNIKRFDVLKYTYIYIYITNFFIKFPIKFSALALRSLFLL